MLRQARISDMESLLTLWDEGYANTPFSEMQYDELHVRRMFANICTIDEVFFNRVVDIEGELHGILIGFIDKNFWGVPTAQTLISYANRDSDKLLKAFVKWSKEKGAKQITVTSVPGKDRYKKMIGKLGFRESGGLHTMEI